jgi:hypothetical protein
MDYIKLTPEDFDKIVVNRLESISNTLVIKGQEYRRNDDPLHNFRIAGKIQNITEEKALLGFATKHLVSFLDIINDMEISKLPKEKVVEEKIGDLINYLILCEASIKEKINNKSI